ncbi:calponin homology domain-containing protein DDB_G0272472 [Anopheles nili]|uniref:calponin homology domain-containing protein DDB_G0272472 n=1 Tax=Anopheles nili TaxID=185578 RepID=UPI00237C144C|nr:calponin homology domain-containing protein DDB_G0272472 [Anopheles nili]
MPDSSRTLADIDDIDGTELKAHLKNWIEQEDIEANLQLQMKKNLIDKMSRTALGKKIALKLQTQQGIVLSPLVLVLNTLVAEFLYTQNCHFSLSIFTNEVPFKNTLPDFTRSSKFRLTRAELLEIFEALGIDHCGGLVEKYEKLSTDQGCRSLLYIVFRSILTAIKVQESQLRRLHRSDKRRATARTLLKELEVEKLHSNVEKLLHRVKSVGRGIVELEKSQQQPTGSAPVPGANEKSKPDDEESSRSLRVCSENVSKLVARLESCTVMFERLIEAVQHQRHEDAAEEDRDEQEANHKQKEIPYKTYTEFLRELKTTEHGKKYVAKLQKQITKLLDKERLQMQAKCDRELRKLEQEYKERLESALASKPTETPGKRTPEPTPSVLFQHDTRSEESQHFMRKIDEKLDQLYQQERNVDGKLATLRNDLQRQEQRQSRYFEALKAAKTKESKLQVLHNVERELMATLEDETNAIIQNARHTIEQLEKESDKINHSFQRYLKKQREDKRKLIDEKVQIWARYNDEKLELNQRQLLNGELDEELPAETVPVVPEVAIPIRVSEEPSEGKSRFENPFRAFDPLQYLKRSRPPASHTKDVAIGTTADVGQQTVHPEEELGNAATTIVHSVPATRVNGNANLSDKLAKDTRDLRRSIEENLQKLDQMSRTYSKSRSSSEKRTYDVVPTNGEETLKPATQMLLPVVDPMSNRSLDDCSSTELGLSDGEVVLPTPRCKPAQSVPLAASSPKLNTTRELLDYATQNIRNEQLMKAEQPQTQPTLAASYSDLSVSSISVASKLSYEKSQSFGGELDRISTGARSNASQNSWS